MQHHLCCERRSVLDNEFSSYKNTVISPQEMLALTNPETMTEQQVSEAAVVYKVN